MKLGAIISKAKSVKCKDRVLPVLSITQRDGFVLQSSRFKKEIASKDKSGYIIVKRNQLVQSIHIDEGGFSVQHLIDEGIVSPAYKVWDVDTSKVNPLYLNTFLRSKPSIAYFKSKLRGTIHRRGKIDDSDILGMDIPVPSLLDQERIVSELTLLSDIIAKTEQQLEELDKLAQCIFYDMFGDPISNEKGWETRLLKDLCDKLYAGGDVPKERFSKTKNALYSVPILSNGKGEGAIYGYTDIPRETSPAITISGRGTIGYSRVQEEPFYPIIRLIVAVPSSAINLVYLHSHISLLSFESTGGAIPQLTVPMVKNRRILCPPLDLQNEFAQKIESIEKQKALIKQSIAETETLFNSRMEFYFGG